MRLHSCGPLPVRFLRASLHWVVITCCRLLFALTCKVKVVLMAPLPKHGALIMASNHISHFDPPIISGYFPRPLDWLAMEELFQAGWSRSFFTWLNCIPVDRTGSDRNALRHALQRLQEMRAIGIFPEGGIRAGEWSILNGAPMKPGLAALSIHSGTAIIPCALIGSDRLYRASNWLRRTTIYLMIGESMEPPSEDARKPGVRERFSEELSKAFIGLRDEAVARFALAPEDLPQTPQARKGNVA